MSDGGAFTSGFSNAYRMMMDREEKKRKQDANLALTNAYLEMEEQRRQSQIAPQKQAFDSATGNAVDAQRRQNSVAIANSAGQQNLMTPEIKEALAQSGIPVGEIPANVNPALTQTAGGQPVTSDMQQAFGSSTMTGLQSANTQANQAQQLLAEAEKRYPPSVLAKMAPLVSKGVPFEKLYAFAESENAKEINRTKTAELNKAYKEVFSNKDLTDEQRAIMLLSVNPSDPIGKMFAERSGKKDLGFTLGQGQTRFDSQGRPIVSVAPKPGRPDRVKYNVITNPDGSQDKVGDDGSILRIKPPLADRDTLTGLSAEENKRYKLLQNYRTQFEKKHKSPLGTFDEDKAAEDPEYADYQKYSEEHRNLTKKSLEGKPTANIGKKVMSASTVANIKMTLVNAAKSRNLPVPTDAEMDAYIEKNYGAIEEPTF